MSKKSVIRLVVAVVLLGIAFLSGALPSMAQATPAMSNVSLLQRDLSGLGYTPMSNIDGIDGPKTIASVYQYQADRDLNLDGIAGPQTMEALTNEVKDVQRVVGTGEDGDYGDLTIAAVKSYQHIHGLQSDGISGPQSMEAMGIARAIANSTYVVVGTPTISASFIESVLVTNNSPAQGTGQTLYQYGVQYNIDPVYALAFFQHESSFGARGIARANQSLGNIRCSSNSSTYTCNGGFRRYKSWESGYEDWYKLIARYVQVDHRTTVKQIMVQYAPHPENDVSAYVRIVEHTVDTWRAKS